MALLYYLACVSANDNSLYPVDGCNTLTSEDGCIQSEEGKDGSEWNGDPCQWCCGEDCAVTTAAGAKCLPMGMLLFDVAYRGHSKNGLGYDTCVSPTPIFPVGSPNYVAPADSSTRQTDTLTAAGITLAAICLLGITGLCAFRTRPRINDVPTLLGYPPVKQQLAHSLEVNFPPPPQRPPHANSLEVSFTARGVLVDCERIPHGSSSLKAAPLHPHKSPDHPFEHETPTSADSIPGRPSVEIVNGGGTFGGGGGSYRGDSGGHSRHQKADTTTIQLSAITERDSTRRSTLGERTRSWGTAISL